jgi:hypothetical protein
MAPKNKPQDITPGTMSQIRPGTPVASISPEEDAAISELAKQQGLSKVEAMRRMVEMMPQTPQRPPRKTIVDDTLSTIQMAREMGVVDAESKNNPVNQYAQLGIIKDIQKKIKQDDDDRMTPRETMDYAVQMFSLKLMQSAMGNDNNPNQSSQIQQISQKYDQVISELKSENEKSRQFYEQRLKEQEDKFKEIVLEKRINDIEEGQKQTLQTLSQQIAEVENQIKVYQNIPLKPSEDQKKDAIEHLEQMGGTLERIKKALTPFGIIPQQGGPAARAASAIDPYKNADGSTNMMLYGIDKATDVLGRVLQAWSQKAPEPKIVQETMIQGGGNGSTAAVREQAPPRKQITYEEYYIALLNKGQLTPKEQEWKNGYEGYIMQQQQERLAKEQPAPQRQANDAAYTEVQEQGQVHEGAIAVSQEQPPEPEQQIPETPAPKKGIVERMQEEQSQISKYMI